MCSIYTWVLFKKPFSFFLNWPVSLCHCLVEPLSSVSSLEVHFDLLDLTELTDMSDQELAEVFADSDEENHNEPRAGKPKYLGTEFFMIYNKFKGPPNSSSMKFLLNTAHSLSNLNVQRFKYSLYVKTQYFKRDVSFADLSDPREDINFPSVIANHENGLPALAGYVFAPFAPWLHLNQRA